MTYSISGIPIILSDYAFTIKVVTKGIADSRRPNTRRPLYRRVTVRVPAVYVISTAFAKQIVSYPDFMRKLEEQIKKSSTLTFFESDSLIFDNPPFRHVEPMPIAYPEDIREKTLSWFLSSWGVGVKSDKNGYFTNGV